MSGVAWRLILTRPIPELKCGLLLPEEIRNVKGEVVKRPGKRFIL